VPVHVHGREHDWNRWGCVAPAGCGVRGAGCSAAGLSDQRGTTRAGAAGEKPWESDLGFGFPCVKWRSPSRARDQRGPAVAFVAQAEGVKAEPFENHSALEIAEQLTLLDHLVFKKIPYE